jgi:hypothetical protein
VSSTAIAVVACVMRVGQGSNLLLQHVHLGTKIAHARLAFAPEQRAYIKTSIIYGVIIAIKKNIPIISPPNFTT